MPLVRKKSSKRQTLRLKNGIEKKVKEHKRKMRKLARKHPELLKRKSKKDPGIPNLWPFKEQLIRHMEKEQEREEELKQKHKERRRQEVEKRRELARKLTQVALTSGNQIEDEEDKDSSAEVKNNADLMKRRWYFKELKSVIEQSDVVLEVLDARDPMGCRAPDIESRILSQPTPSGGSNKKIILVLNKIDLVPIEVAEKWMKYLRREFPTVAFKSSTQEKKRLSQAHSKIDLSKVTPDQLKTSACLGAGALMQLLKNYSRSHNLKTAINVGVIGYPNVGKSSVINSLKRERAVQVGAEPGVTKIVQSVKLDKLINLLDSPGVLFGTGSEDTNLLLRNAIKTQEIQDPLSVVGAIVKKCPAEKLCQVYKISKFSDAEEFVRLVALKRSIGKGGLPDLDTGAKAVINDWNRGKIPFYSLPPKTHDIQSSEVVTGWATEFDIERFLERSDRETFVQLSEEMKQKPSDASAFVVEGSRPTPLGRDIDIEAKKESLEESKLHVGGDVFGNSEAPFEFEMKDEDEVESKENKGSDEVVDERKEDGDAAMSDADEKESKMSSSKSSKASQKPIKVLQAADEHNLQSNKAVKKNQKKQKKKQQKERRKSIASEDVSSEAYDFAKDWAE